MARSWRWSQQAMIRVHAYRYDWDEQYDIFLLKFSELFGAAHASEISFIQGAPMYGSIGSFIPGY